MQNSRKASVEVIWTSSLNAQKKQFSDELEAYNQSLLFKYYHLNFTNKIIVRLLIFGLKTDIPRILNKTKEFKYCDIVVGGNEILMFDTCMALLKYCCLNV